MKPRGVSTSGCVVCQAGPDVRVRVRSSVVQVEVEQTCVRAVAPIAAILSSHPKKLLLAGINPAACHFTYFVYVPDPYFVFPCVYVF